MHVHTQTHMETNYIADSSFWIKDIYDISQSNWNGFIICDRWGVKNNSMNHISSQRYPHTLCYYKLLLKLNKDWYQNFPINDCYSGNWI